MDSRHSLLDLFGSLNDDGAVLGTFQRVLLITDGTVTDVLEAYSGEPVRVVKLAQSLGVPDAETPELDLAPDERVLRRSILLRGTISGRNMLHAESVISPDRLPPGVFEAILASERPLGRILAAHRVETFREIVALGYVPAASCAEHFEVDKTAKFLFRTYRIFAGHQPVIRVTEKFPATSFASSLDL